MVFLKQLLHYLTFPFLLQGIQITLVISIGALFGAVVLGAILTMFQMSKISWLSFPTRIYSVIFRGTPLILQLVFFYDALPHFGLTLSATWTAIVVFSLNEATFFAEIFRAGIVSIDQGQILAGESLGMSSWKLMRYVVGPQAFRTIVPMLGNQIVGLIKNTSLASIISVNELTLRSESLVAQNFAFFPVFFASGLMYLLLTSAVAVFQIVTEWRLDISNSQRHTFKAFIKQFLTNFGNSPGVSKDSTVSSQVNFLDLNSPKDFGEFRSNDVYDALSQNRNSHRQISLHTFRQSGLVDSWNSSEKNLLEINSVRKSYRGKPVLKDISFSVAAGEVVVLMGSSGSGKSTLLRLINHLDFIDGGEILVSGNRVGYSADNKPLTKSEITKARIEARTAMVFQHFNLFQNMTALENITLAPLCVYKEKPDAVQSYARSLLGAVGLSEHENDLPCSLSGGQQQRVAVARALAIHPKLVLFDEPTSALDPELVGEVLETIRELAEIGMTMLIVTHEVRFARQVADRVIFMAEGTIVEQGPPEQVLQDPKDSRTRRFLRLEQDIAQLKEEISMIDESTI